MPTQASARRLLLVATLAAGLTFAAVASPASARQDSHRPRAVRLEGTVSHWTGEGASPWAFARRVLCAIFGLEGSVMDPLGGH